MTIEMLNEAAADAALPIAPASTPVVVVETPEVRAVVALNASKTEFDLRALVEKAKAITVVNSADGREEWLATRHVAAYTAGVPKGMERSNSERSGSRTRQHCGFFAPAPFMAGRATDTRPARGRSPLDCVRVTNLPATWPARVVTLRLGLSRLTQERFMSQSVLGFPPASAHTSGATSTFNFGTHAVRVVVRDDEPWFVAADVARTLGYRDSEQAARHLGDHQRGTTICGTPCGDQKLTIINESGLYRLVLRSRKPEAEKFSDWVTGEVLPSIRKTGGYAQASSFDPTNGQEMAAARKVALDYFDAYRAAIHQGQTAPDMAQIPAEALHGLMAHALMSQQMLVSFDYSTGGMVSRIVPGDSSVVSFSKGNYVDIAQRIPMERLPELMNELNKRVAQHLGALKERLQRDGVRRVAT